MPKSKLTSGFDRISNLQIAHAFCNQAKGNSTEDLQPDFFINFCSNSKKERALNRIVKKTIRESIDIVKTNPVDFKQNQASALWNEIVTNGFQNLSYNLFLDYFERYTAVKIKKLGLEKLIKTNLIEPPHTTPEDSNSNQQP